MTIELELDVLLASLEPERAGRILALPPDQQVKLDAALAAQAQSDAPAMEAARARLLAGLTAPPGLLSYIEQHRLTLWSATTEALQRFVAGTEEAAAAIRRELFDASHAVMPAHFSAPADTETTRLEIHGWMARDRVETTCKTRVVWNAEGSLTVEAWIAAAPLAKFPGLGQGYGLIRLPRGASFPFPLGPRVRSRTPELHLEATLPAPPQRQARAGEGLPLPPSVHRLALFEGASS